VKQHNPKIINGAYTENDVPKNGTVDMSDMTWANAQLVDDVSYLSLREKRKRMSVHARIG
jgi:hypothetical protein